MSHRRHKFRSVLSQLQDARIYHVITDNRDNSVSIEVAVPGQRWEIDFLDDGSVEVEIFQSDGTIHEESKLTELFQKFSD